MIELVNNYPGPRWWHEEEDWSLRPNGYYFFAKEDGFSCCGPYETEAECQEALDQYEVQCEE